MSLSFDDHQELRTFSLANSAATVVLISFVVFGSRSSRRQERKKDGVLGILIESMED